MKQKEENSFKRYWWLVVVVIALAIWWYVSFANGESKARAYLESYDYNRDIIDIKFSSSTNTASIEMRPLGERNNQVWDGLIALYIAYEGASKYSIKIIWRESINGDYRCSYLIDGNLYRRWRTASINEDDSKSQDLYIQINEEIKNGLCK